MKNDNVKIGLMEDQSILNSAYKKGESYLDDLAFAVCVNGESLEKYKKIVEKKYDTDVYSNMVQFANTLHQQVARRQFTNTSLLSLKLLGKNAGLSEMAIDMIVDHLRSEFREEQLKEEERKREDTAFWKQCSPNNKYQLQEYLKKFPTGLFAARAVSLIADLERIEKKAIEESRVFNQCRTQRDYMNYLSKYPNGTYSAKAKVIIEEFDKKEIEENRVYNLCKDKSDYFGYLRKYPNGKYVKEAQEKIKVLENAENSMAKETAFWNQCSPNSISQLKEYLRKYPKGMYATRAKSQIANLERIEKEAIEESRMYNQCRSKTEYLDYLQKYPNGYYRNKAMYEIDMLDKASKKERDAYVKEQDIYEQCKTKDDYLHYISLYPNGKYVSRARNKIEHLEKIEGIKEGIKKEKEKEKIKTNDVVPDEIRDKLTKLNKTAGRSYILAALAFAFLPNVFRWNHWAHIELEEYGNAPTLWLFWLPIATSLWGYFCHWLDSEVFMSIRSTRSAMNGHPSDRYLTIIPCFVLLLWMVIDGLSMGYFMEDILKVFMGPIVCGIAWCYGLYCEYKMSRIAKKLLPDDN